MCRAALLFYPMRGGMNVCVRACVWSLKGKRATQRLSRRASQELQSRNQLGETEFINKQTDEATKHSVFFFVKGASYEVLNAKTASVFAKSLRIPPFFTFISPLFTSFALFFLFICLFCSFLDNINKTLYLLTLRTLSFVVLRRHTRTWPGTKGTRDTRVKAQQLSYLHCTTHVCRSLIVLPFSSFFFF